LHDQSFQPFDSGSSDVGPDGIDPRYHVADEVVGAAGAAAGVAAGAGRVGGTNDQQIHGPSDEGCLGVPAVPAGSRVDVDAVGDPRGVGVG